MVVGIDEAGRGALAGPISVGFSCFFGSDPVLTWKYWQSQKQAGSDDFLDWHKSVDDSKALSQKQRQEIYVEMVKHIPTQVIFISHQIIDRHGLSKGIKAAMVLGLAGWVLNKHIDSKAHIYLDGSLKLPESLDLEIVAQILDDNILSHEVLEFLKSQSSDLFEGSIDTSWLVRYFTKVETVIKGDAKILSIAAASIAAKVKRDSLMVSLAKEFSDYQWEKNKGYATKVHRQKILQLGVSGYHRKSFLTK
jgi:ribonuclease HII